MDPESWRLRFLWYWPQPPKKKIREFVRLGDAYRQDGNHRLARYCYAKSEELALRSNAVHLSKKLKTRV